MEGTACIDVVSFYATSDPSAKDLARTVARYRFENPNKAFMLELVRTDPSE